MTRFEKPPVTKDRNDEDLPEQFRRISAALWDAVQRRDTNAVNGLLDQRQTVLESLQASDGMSDETRRTLRAQLAGDKYLMRQLTAELEVLERRLNGVSARRAAAGKFARPVSPKSHLNRVG